jgi:hypothetical protein
VNVLISNREKLLVDLLNGHFSNDLNKINRKRYFMVPERIFIDYNKDKVSQFEVWLLLATYYLLDQNETNAFTREEILKTSIRGFGDIRSIFKFEDSFPIYLFSLELLGWIEENEDHTITLNII